MLLNLNILCIVSEKNSSSEITSGDRADGMTWVLC